MGFVDEMGQIFSLGFSKIFKLVLWILASSI